MCYAPVKRNKDIIDRAVRRISEGKLQEAEKLLGVAGGQLATTRFGTVTIQGKTLRAWYYEAQAQLASASSTPKASQETEQDLALNRIFN